MLKVAIFNFKGGTGKSTTALNLGSALAAPKRRCLLVDLDGQRTLSFGLGLDGQSPTAMEWLQGEEVIPLATPVKHLSLIPGNLALFQLQTDSDLFTPALDRIQETEMVLMDCPPSLGVASVQAILSSDRVLMPVLCEPAALKGLSEAIELIRSDRPEIPIDVLRVRYKPRLRLTQDALDLLIESAKGLSYTLLHNTIPENVAVAESIAQQKPLAIYSPKSQGARAYKSLGKECSTLWGM